MMVALSVEWMVEMVQLSVGQMDEMMVEMSVGYMVEMMVELLDVRWVHKWVIHLVDLSVGEKI